MFERFNKVVYSGIAGGLAGSIISGLYGQQELSHILILIAGSAVAGGAIAYHVTRPLKP